MPTKELNYEILGLYDLGIARGMTHHQAYQKTLEEFSNQTGNVLGSEELEEILGTRAGLNRYQNHLREMAQYSDWLKRTFEKSVQEESSQDSAKFVVLSLFRKSTGYDLKFDELDYLLKNTPKADTEYGLTKEQEKGVWKEYQKGKTSYQIAMMYHQDPLHITEAIDYWQRHPDEVPEITESEVLIPPQSHYKKIVLKRKQETPKIVYNLGNQKQKTKSFKFPWNRKSREGILERTAKKTTNFFSKIKTNFLTRPVYIPC